jgi:hypothetical protein
VSMLEPWFWGRGQRGCEKGDVDWEGDVGRTTRPVLPARTADVIVASY